MIVDSLTNCNLYYGVNEKFAKAFDFIKKAVDENLAAGKYEIDGNSLYALIQEYTTKNEQDCKLEGHRKYIDIQYIISGTEMIEIVDSSKSVSNVSYNEERDAEFFENNTKAASVVLEAGEYGIFYPHDLHKPAMSFEGKATEVKKIVVKVKL